MDKIFNPLNFTREQEITNGRMAMIGLFAAVHNYLLFGWVVYPGIF
tara:strand:+ start:221 stop:358 length:138 start_codon:yes stop_codon:yes gene_type:complete